MPKLDGAFINIGEEKNALIHNKDILDKNLKLKPGQPLLVQIKKDSIGTKGARVTTDISLAGKYIVLLPFQTEITISNKITENEEKQGLKSLVKTYLKEKKQGAIIRTAETAGIHGIIIPKRRNVQVNSTVSKVSAGATSYVKVARVNNLNETIRYLKEKGLWIIGTDGDAKTEYYNQDLKGPLAIIIGSEGFGMSKLVKENADILIKIPMFGKINSLNASVSAGIIIYEAIKQGK